MSRSIVKLKNVEMAIADDNKSNQVPAQEQIITTDMLDEKIRRLKILINSRSCLLPNTLDTQMQESDEFFNLLGKFLDQKILLARRCIHVSQFMEEIYSLVALAITPALILVLFRIIEVLSTAAADPQPISSYFLVLQDVRPIALCAVPLLLYFHYVWFVAKPTKDNAQPADKAIDIDEVLSIVYQKLKVVVDFFEDNAKRKKLLYRVWAVTTLFGIWLMSGGDHMETYLKLLLLLMVVGVNYLVGLSLTTFPPYNNNLYAFYTPLERSIRIISFSPIVYAILNSLGTLCIVPIFSVRLDYNKLRRLGITIITMVQQKFQEVLAVQRGMRNVRELLKVTTHAQDLTQSLLSLQVDREAGRALVSEVPKAAGKLLWWASDTVRKHFQPSTVQKK